ncbi:HAMP domain-containing protein [Pararhodobacter marinus]|uniref:HAMP domain-containing protein n=1 Tax=Pararhodobacter marinus TaxID=2184063 RepID=UPI0035151756
MRLLKSVPRFNAMNFRLSLFIKISAVLVGVTLLVETASFTIAYRSATEHGVENMHYVTELRLDDLAETIAAPVRFGDTARLEDLIQSFAQIDSASLIALVVTDPGGNRIGSFGDAARLDRNLAAAAGAARVEAGDMLRTGLGDGRFLMETPIHARDGAEPVGSITSIWTTAPALARAHEDTPLKLALAGVILVVLIPLSMLLMRQLITLPMRRLAMSLAEIGQGQYDGAIPELTRGDEIGDFARHISDLRDRLRIAHDDELAREADHKEQLRVVATLRDGLAALARRDLGVSFDSPFSNRYETLREDFNQTVTALRDTINIVIDSVTRMRQGADDMTRSADNLSKRTETQAATLEETAAAIQQISTRVTETATNAREAERIARGAQQKAQVSEPIVREAIDAMAAI